MFLKQERPEMDDFETTTNLVVKEEISKLLTVTVAKTSHNIFHNHLLQRVGGWKGLPSPPPKAIFCRAFFLLKKLTWLTHTWLNLLPISF